LGRRHITLIFFSFPFLFRLLDTARNGKVLFCADRRRKVYKPLPSYIITMAQKKGNKTGQNAQAKELEQTIASIIKRARREKSPEPIVNVIKDNRISKVARQQLAIRYMEELQRLTTKVFFRSTLKKFSKSIEQVAEALKEQKLNECRKYIEQKWKTWMDTELWKELEKQGIDVSLHYQRVKKAQEKAKSSEPTEKEPTELELLKQYA